LRKTELLFSTLMTQSVHFPRVTFTNPRDGTSCASMKYADGCYSHNVKTPQIFLRKLFCGSLLLPTAGLFVAHLDELKTESFCKPVVIILMFPAEQTTDWQSDGNNRIRRGRWSRSTYLGIWMMRCGLEATSSRHAALWCVFKQTACAKICGYGCS
jgi:hypothetical protein